MYRIDEDNRKEKYILLLPATLDDHFPLLKYMFWSKEYRVEILDNTEGIIDVGLRYANNDMCYPFIIMVGQIIQSLKSGKYDIKNTRILIPTAGDACRGACYIGLISKALKKAGFEECKVVTLNVRHVEEDINMKISLDMAMRGLYSMFYGDILMMLSNQTRVYELESDETLQLKEKWNNIISEDLKRGKHLSFHWMKKNMDKMCAEFASVEQSKSSKQRILIAGEFYTKYCGLGNWDVAKYMEDRGCEVYVNGLSWYALYYIDTHIPENNGIEKYAFLAVRRILLKYQNYMIDTIRKYGFYSMDNIDIIKSYSTQYVSSNLKTGDGWLMGAEIIGGITSGINKILCVAPFGCMPNACSGRGLYPYLQRCFPQAYITGVETDASASKQNYYNRVEMLIHAKK